MPVSKVFLDNIDANTVSINLCSKSPMIDDDDIEKIVATIKK